VNELMNECYYSVNCQLCQNSQCSKTDPQAALIHFLFSNNFYCNCFLGGGGGYKSVFILDGKNWVLFVVACNAEAVCCSDMITLSVWFPCTVIVRCGRIMTEEC
jgi:hypothetical protein